MFTRKWDYEIWRYAKAWKDDVDFNFLFIINYSDQFEFTDKTIRVKRKDYCIESRRGD